MHCVYIIYIYTHTHTQCMKLLIYMTSKVRGYLPQYIDIYIYIYCLSLCTTITLYCNVLANACVYNALYVNFIFLVCLKCIPIGNKIFPLSTFTYISIISLFMHQTSFSHNKCLYFQLSMTDDINIFCVHVLAQSRKHNKVCQDR